MKNDLSKYYKVQKYMKTGDHLGWKSNSMVGWFIRYFDSGPISHSEVILRLSYKGLEKRRFNLGAVGSGVSLHMLSRALSTYKGEVWWYPLKEEYNHLRPKMAGYMLDKIDVKYDYNSLFQNAFGRVSTEVKKLFCTEYSNLVWNQAGIATGFPIGGPAPTPVDIDKFTIFQFKKRIL